MIANEWGDPNVHCRNCGKVAPRFDHDWYGLTVNDSDRTKRYRWLGVFCSMRCLAQQIPTMASIEGTIRARNRVR